MENLKKELARLTHNLNTLREREAKYGGNAPLELLNEIEDHQTAIALYRQTLRGDLSEAELREALAPLNIALTHGETIVTGDITGSVVAMGKGAQIIINQARSALEEARRQEAYETSLLAEAVGRIAHNMQSLVSPFAGQSTPDKTATIVRRDSLIVGGKVVGSPYKALLDYKIPDAPLFYGRRAAIRELFALLEPGTLTILHAESGAGKSSLLQAGLAARLLVRGHLPLLVRPWNQNPAQAIKRAFLPNLNKVPGLAEAPLPHFLRRVTDILGDDTRLYIFLDQFEEFFTFLTPDARAAFIAALGDCLEDESLPIPWLIALRDEYFGRLATFSPRIRRPFDRQYLLHPLSYEEAVQVIVEPAAQVKITYQPELIPEILIDLTSEETGALAAPELQLVCSALFDSLSPGQTVIPLSTYEELERAPGILRNHLNQVLKRNFNPREEDIARRLLEAMVTSEKCRALRTLPELVAAVRADEPTVAAVLRQLVENRLVQTREGVDDEESSQTYELAHDYLLDEIQLDPEAQARKAAQELLNREVETFRRYGSLIWGRKLDIIASQREFLTLTSEANRLLRLSLQARNRRRIQRIALIVAAFLALLLLTANSFVQRNRSEQLRRAAEAERSRAVAAEQTAIAERNRAQEAEAEARMQSLQARRARQMAEASSLSAAALNLVDSDTTLSLSLALEAINRDSSVAGQNVLRSILLHVRPWQTLSTQNIPVLAATWSPDGRQIALGLQNGDIQLWDAQSHTPQATLIGHTTAVRRLAFSSDGTRLASAAASTRPVDLFDPADGASGEAILWDLTTGQPQAVLNRHAAGVFSLAFSPDGDRLATASADGTVKIWDAATGAEERTLRGHNGKVRAVAWRPDGKQLASAGDRGDIFIWDAATGAHVSTLTSTPQIIFDVAWSPDGDRLASASADGTVRLWDVTAGHIIDTFVGHKSFVRSISWHPEGRRLASAAFGNNKIIIWDTETGEAELTLTGHTDWIYHVEWDASGTRLLSAAKDNTARIWQVNVTPGVTILSGHTDDPNETDWHPSKPLLLSAGKDAQVLLWDIRQGNLLARFVGHTANIWSVGWRPDGTQFATTSDDTTVRVWNLPTLTPGAPPITVTRSVLTLTGHTAPVFDAAWSPDGGTLATASADKTIRLWNARTGEPESSLIGHKAGVLEADFSPDGKRLASAGADNQVIVWNLTTGQPEQTLSGHTGFVWDVEFDPGGTRLATASGDATVRLWDLTTGEAIIIPNERPVTSVAWNHAGTMLAYASDDGTARLWDVQTGQPAGNITGHKGGVWNVSWSPDDVRLATAAADNQVRLFFADFSPLLDLARRYQTHILTDDELEFYLGDADGTGEE